MGAPFGLGVGDFVAVGTLAWSLYKSTKGAPESFQNIHVEVLSLHAVLKEAEETVFERSFSKTRQARLKVIGEGCNNALADLQALVQKYESLGMQSKRTWDRMRWGNEDIVEIRARLTSNVTMLTAFITTSQAMVELKLDDFIKEFRQGKREGSVLSLQTVDSLTTDERAVWRSIRKELEGIGITTAAFEANHDFIFDWFVHAAEIGAFEEQDPALYDDAEPVHLVPSKSSNGSNGSPDSSSSAEMNAHPESTSRTIPMRDDKFRTTLDDPRASPLERKRRPAGDDPALKNRGLESEGQSRVPPVARLFAVVLRPQQRRLLLTAAKNPSNYASMANILDDNFTRRLIDQKTLDNALVAACVLGMSDRNAKVIERLLTEGANIDVLVKSNEVSRLAILLQYAVLKDDLTLVQLLIRYGAEVNLLNRYTALIIAAKHNRLNAIGILLDNGATVDLCSAIHGTALMVALRARRIECAQLLIQRGADVRYCIKQMGEADGRLTPMDVAMTAGFPPQVDLLVRRRAVIDIQQARRLVSEYRLTNEYKFSSKTTYGEKLQIYRLLDLLIEEFPTDYERIDQELLQIREELWSRRRATTLPYGDALG